MCAYAGARTHEPQIKSRTPIVHVGNVTVKGSHHQTTLQLRPHESGRDTELFDIQQIVLTNVALSFSGYRQYILHEQKGICIERVKYEYRVSISLYYYIFLHKIKLKRKRY